MNEDETPTEPDDADEPTYQDWTELQSPLACSWCSALVPRDRIEDHTTFHLDVAAALNHLRTQSTA